MVLPMNPSWSSEVVLKSVLYAHTALLDTHNVIAFLCSNVIMALYIPLG